MLFLQTHPNILDQQVKSVWTRYKIQLLIKSRSQEFLLAFF